ncbi:MAG: ATP-binding protein [Chloroflexi bacterium]|nr:MAG: ATP-binding protein [Chloroflexota bacterium]
MVFVNRDRELNELEKWWARPDASLGIVWGRRRVGKTWLLQRFSQFRRSVFHVATGRPLEQELRELSRAAAHVFAGGERDLATDPFRDWDDAFECLGRAAATEPLLVVLDEFPELLAVTPWLPGYLRAMWEGLKRTTKLKIVLSGSAVRTMWAMQAYREPLYGRFDVNIRLDPFWPHEAAQMLQSLAPADRALVWGILGGIPTYLEWWEPEYDVAENIEVLVGRPGSPLLAEGDLVLATETGTDAGKYVLHAIANGRTRRNEIEDVVGEDATLALQRLEELLLVERVLPVTDDSRSPRSFFYRVADNFLAFLLGVLDPYRAEIDRGLGETIVQPVMHRLDDFMGARWEEAFRMHLRRMARDGALAPDAMAVGPFWNSRSTDPSEIDAVVLAGVERRAVLVGEAKWTRRVDATRIRRDLERKAAALPRPAPDLRYAVCAREVVDNTDGVLAITADDIFDG